MPGGGYDGDEGFHRGDWMQFAEFVRSWFTQPAPLTLGQLELFLERVGKDLEGRSTSDLAVGRLEAALSEHGLEQISLGGALELVEAGVRRGLTGKNAGEVFQTLDLGIVAPPLLRRGRLTAASATSLAAFAVARSGQDDVLVGLSVGQLQRELEPSTLGAISVRDLRELLENVAVRK